MTSNSSLIHEKLSQTSELSSIERQVMQLKLFIKEHVQTTASAELLRIL